MDRYEEALERAKKGLPIDEVFPELKESEDERIRKHIIDIIKDNAKLKRIPCDAEIAYLEKQKEQKPESCDCSRDEESYTNGIHHVLMNPEAYGLIKQKPAEWSEKDENIRKLLIWQVHRNIEDETNDLAQSVYDGIKGHDPDLEESIEDWKKCLAWLKSLRPQSHWKPSEEQIEALENSTALNEEQGAHLYSLLCDLKKLL